MLRWRGVVGRGSDGSGGGVEAVLGWPLLLEVLPLALAKTSPSVLNSVSNSLMCKELMYVCRRLLIASWTVRLNSWPGPEAVG